MKKTKFIFTLMLGCSLATMARAADTSYENCVKAVGADKCVQIGDSDTYYALSGPAGNQTMTVYGTKESGGTVASVPQNAFSVYNGNSSSALDGVTSLKFSGNVNIENSAFQGATGLTSVNLTGVQSVGNTAFAGATNLTDVNFTGVQTIGNSAFANMHSLVSADLSGVQTIGNGAFYDTGLTTVKLAGVQTIEDNAFENATSLTSVDLTSVGTIKSRVFAGATSLTSIDLSGIQSLDKRALTGMNLQNLTISENSPVEAAYAIDGGNYYYALSSLASAQRDLQEFEEQIPQLREDGMSEEEIEWLLEDYQESIAYAQPQVDAARENLLAQTLKINCKGDAQVCKAKLLSGLPDEYKAVLGTKVPFDVGEATYLESDGKGGYAIKTYGGKIVGFKNKRIYTLDEANQVAGKVNRVSIKYR